MENRLIKLLQHFADGTYSSNGHFVDNTQVDDVADFLIANGIIVPPCKVGDSAYHLTSIDTVEELELAEIFDGKVCSVSKDEKTLWIFARYDNGLNYWYAESDIGKRLFFTKEQAEKALAEREGK